MKELVVNGETFQYEVEYDVSEFGESTWTSFYQGTEMVTRRKYLIFGSKITKEEPKHVFRIPYDIESPEHTKDFIRGEIEYQIKLWKRPEELSRGEII